MKSLNHIIDGWLVITTTEKREENCTSTQAHLGSTSMQNSDNDKIFLLIFYKNIVLQNEAQIYDT